MENSKIIGYSSGIISAILLGSVGIFVRNISSNAYIITFARLGLGLVFLILFLFLKKEIKNIKTTKFSFSLLSTGMLIGGVILCYTNAVKNTSLSNAAFLLYLGPLIAIGIAAILLKEKTSLLNGGLFFLTFFGFLFILEFKVSFNVSESEGYLWGFGSAMCYALYIVFNRNIPDEIPALTRSFYQLLFGAITMLPFLDASLFEVSMKDIYWLAAAGFFQGFLTLSLFVLAVKYLKAVEYGTISYFDPLVASLIGFFLYSENLTSLQFVGCAIVLSGGIVHVIVAQNKLNRLQ